MTDAVRKTRLGGADSPNNHELATAQCVAVYDRFGHLGGYWSRRWQYGLDANRRWARWRRDRPIRRGSRDRGRAISDWDLGSERLLRNGYRLLPVPEDEAVELLSAESGRDGGR